MTLQINDNNIIHVICLPCYQICRCVMYTLNFRVLVPKEIIMYDLMF